MHSDGRKVDIMVANHLPSRMRPRLAQRAAFAAPAGEFAGMVPQDSVAIAPGVTTVAIAAFAVVWFKIWLTY